ncbi:MAG: histidine kinase [Pirellulales bacterium]
MDAYFLSNDLAIGSRVDAAATRAGVELGQFSAAERLLAATSEDPAAAVILDLAALPSFASTPGSSVGDLVAALRASSPHRRIVAFAPHVHERQIAAARQAGCDHVLSRGQFFAGLDRLLAELRSAA